MKLILKALLVICLASFGGLLALIQFNQTVIQYDVYGEPHEELPMYMGTWYMEPNGTEFIREP